MKAGEKLTEAKRLVKHGQWMPWLRSNFPGTHRTATNYMRLAANEKHVSDCRTVREALAALAPVKPESEPVEQPQPAIPTRVQADALMTAHFEARRGETEQGIWDGKARAEAAKTEKHIRGDGKLYPTLAPVPDPPEPERSPELQAGESPGAEPDGEPSAPPRMTTDEWLTGLSDQDILDELVLVDGRMVSFRSLLVPILSLAAEQLAVVYAAIHVQRNHLDADELVLISETIDELGAGRYELAELRGDQS
jgi:hypothetical protein